MFTVAPASELQFGEVLRWLEHEEREAFEGFYCKKENLTESYATGQMFCGSRDGAAIAFATFALQSVGYIEIMEVHPDHRRKGFGTKLASYTIGHLFTLGAPSISITCAPRSSEVFWRSLGFVTPLGYTPRQHEAPRLTLNHAS